VDRFLLHVANAIALLFGLLAMALLALALIDTLRGAHSMESYVLVGVMALVPYCFAGTLHRIVGIGRKD
jgi:hypothetical protein